MRNGRSSEVEFDRWLVGLNVARVKSILRALRCESVIVKYLQSNNNSKNQIYLAPTVNHLACLPMGTPIANVGSSKKNSGVNGPLFTIPLTFFWLSPSGVVRAPEAKLCDYSQYPEVRFSGFLRGCADPPSHLMAIEKRGREGGRILLIAISKAEGKCYGLVVPAISPLNRQLRELPTEQQGVLRIWLLREQSRGDSRDLLLRKLCWISDRGWIAGQRLTSAGLIPYRARNGGGYTLEATLGIVSNSDSGPDFHGWEVKQRNVKALSRPRRGEVTLFDIAPDGGLFQDLGPIDFTLHFGSARSSSGRYDFTGKHRTTKQSAGTKLKLELSGFDGGRIDPSGHLSLNSPSGDPAMSWSFRKLIEHWNRKHALAAFVRSENRDVDISGEQVREYQYGNRVELGVGTDFRRFLSAIAHGKVAFDPGLNIKLGMSGRWRAHGRFPFRVSSSDLPLLYTDFETVDACSVS